MSAREQPYNTQEALQRIWNGQSFDSDENKDESHELASEDESSKSEDASSFKRGNVAHDSAKSNNDEASDDGDGRNQVNQQQQYFTPCKANTCKAPTSSPCLANGT